MSGEFQKFFWGRVVQRLSTPEACKEVALWSSEEKKRANDSYISALFKSVRALGWNLLLVAGVGFLPKLLGDDFYVTLVSLSESNLVVRLSLWTVYFSAGISLLTSVISAYGNRFRVRNITKFADEYGKICEIADHSQEPFESAFIKAYDEKSDEMSALAKKAAQKHWAQSEKFVNLSKVSFWLSTLVAVLVFFMVAFV